MADLDGGPAVLDESRQIHLVATILKVGLSERHVGELEILGSFGEFEGRAAQGTGEVEVAARAGSGARGGEERRGSHRWVLGGVGRKNGGNVFRVDGQA